MAFALPCHRDGTTVHRALDAMILLQWLRERSSQRKDKTCEMYAVSVQSVPKKTRGRQGFLNNFSTVVFSIYPPAGEKNEAEALTTTPPLCRAAI